MVEWSLYSETSKSIKMSPATILLLLIGILSFNENVSAEFQSCSQSNATQCECVDVENYQISYSCSDKGNNSVDLYCQASKEVKITCEENTASKEWYNLLDGIDLSGDYDLVVIRKCPIPEKRIRDILSSLAIGKVKILTIDYINEPQNTFHARHFENLDSVERFEFRNNKVSSLPEDIFVGLPNIKYLFLNRNRLQRIPVNFFKPVPEVQFLDLAENDVSRLEVDTFKHLPKLNTLNLNGNKLTNLTRELFMPLTDLTRLDLSINGLITLNGTLFQDLSKLQELNLNFNNISVLPEGIFLNLKSLRTFKGIGAFNKLKAELPSRLFSNLELLHTVIIERNNLSRIPEDTFNGTIGLKKLSLKANGLKELPGTLFHASTEIANLDLSYNKLAVLNETLFRGLRKLQELNLNWNKLSAIYGKTFADLRLLEKLYLEDNRLSSLQDDVFKHLDNLRFIYLNNNQLLDMKSSISDDSLLRNCLRLEKVYLRNNSINQIFGDWQILLTNLNYLDLSHNKLEILKMGDFQFLQANVRPINVILDHNNISIVDLENYEHSVERIYCDKPPCKYDRRELKVSLRSNPINCGDCRNYNFIRLVQRKMSSAALNYMEVQDKEELSCIQPAQMLNTSLVNVNLRNLYCSVSECPESCSCRFRAVDEVTEVNCTSVPKLPTWLPNNTLVELYLPHNNLENLSMVSPLMGSHVAKLSLSWNVLTNIDDLSIPHSLKVLELDHNRIATLSKSSIETLNRTKAIVTLYNNPWKCDCMAKYLLIFIKHRVDESLIPQVANITCAESGRPIIHFSVEDLCSNSFYLYIIFLAMAIFGVLFGAAALLYLRFEHEIKVFMFAHKICLWLVTEKEVDRDKEFDAFISYSHHDEEFVVKHLIPNLENGPYPYKLCLHYRNWIVGDLIPEQIVRSVGSSRRTIIVLSQNYLESRWANMEFRTAYLQALKERHARVIIILLEDLDPNQKLDPELKAYMTMNTYLKWGDSSFWEKLRYALPHPQHYKKMKSTKKRANIIDGKNRRKLLEALNLRDDGIEKPKKSTDILIC